jgi:hypothetical protein
MMNVLSPSFVKWKEFYMKDITELPNNMNDLIVFTPNDFTAS